MRQYRDFCEKRGLPRDAPVRSDIALEWLSSLADAGRCCPRTIAVYKSALSTTAEMEAPATAARPNPMDAPKIKRLLQGIARDRAEITRRRRVANAATPLTFDIVQELRACYSREDPRDRIHYAALALGVAGCGRPSEILGSAAYPERALRQRQITFYHDDEGRIPAIPAPELSASPPRCLVLHLEISKTDQLREGREKLIGATAAVTALWELCCSLTHRDKDALLFTNARGGRLTLPALIMLLRSKLANHGRSDLLGITGRSLRQGGASELSAMGLDPSDMAQFGWAPESKVPLEIYARNPRVKRARAFAISRSMGASRIQSATPTRPPAATASSSS